MSEKLCLKWNDFQDNTNAAFGSFRNDSDFSDITLACEDGHQIEAHKVILAASSPFFQKLLKMNKHPHPLIYMRGMKSEDLVAVMDFLYYGEANVYQGNIDAFLSIAEELKLKGLIGDSKVKEDYKPFPETATNRRKHGFKSTKPKTEQNQTFEVEETNYKQFEPESEQDVTAVAVTNHEVSSVNISEIQELDELVKSMMRKSENMCNDGSKKAQVCTVCGKEGFQNQIRDHIEANHLEGVSIPCTFCENTFRSRNALRQHNAKAHR